ncbi:MAG: acyl-CoA synthetase FdrA [Chloroflexi bacterium]|nr:acyl-CoA synthetase FdrA [Chloroflexota bacterium]
MLPRVHGRVKFYCSLHLPLFARGQAALCGREIRLSAASYDRLLIVVRRVLSQLNIVFAMTAIKVDIRRGAYYDSVVLMQLQRSLVALPGVLDAGVVMGTQANKDILAQSGLLMDEARAAGEEDLVIAVKAEDEAAADAALKQVDELLAKRRAAGEQTFRPKTLESAAQMLPEAQWVLISVPGQYAAGVAREALRLGKHVFLYSDNVSLEDEIALKKEATSKGLLLMGPDCGTAIVAGVGLGFANRVRSGAVGLVGASGTGLQQVTSRIHQLEGGVTQALGTGGRDLSEQVGALAALQGLDLLSRDPDTRVIVLISKPPSPAVAERLLKVARAAGKPVVVDFIGYAPADGEQQRDNIHFAHTLDEAAALAVDLAQDPTWTPAPFADIVHDFEPGQRYLRGLFSGGTLAYEALLILQDFVPGVYSNVPLDPAYKLENPLESREHTLIDLGEDEFTVGRLHPMMDNDLRIRRLHQEAADPEVAVILLDVVLGYGAHPDPAGDLAPAIAAAREQAGRPLEFVAVVVGTDEDPQDLGKQVEQLEAVGARVFTSNQAAVTYVGHLLRQLGGMAGLPPVSLDAVRPPLAVGLESFAESLEAQDAKVVHVDWRPPAGGNERLAAILARMKG